MVKAARRKRVIPLFFFSSAIFLSHLQMRYPVLVFGRHTPIGFCLYYPYNCVCISPPAPYSKPSLCPTAIWCYKNGNGTQLKRWQRSDGTKKIKRNIPAKMMRAKSSRRSILLPFTSIIRPASPRPLGPYCQHPTVVPLPYLFHVV